MRKAIGRLHSALWWRHMCCRIVPSVGHTAAAVCSVHHARCIRHANEKAAYGRSEDREGSSSPPVLWSAIAGAPAAGTALGLRPGLAAAFGGGGCAGAACEAL